MSVQSEMPMVSDISPSGTHIDDVSLEIDYDIIRHFSQHLYASPNKAVEELVANSFDAMATNCYVYLPGSYTRDSVLVWDNGESMNVDSLHKLWWIARSPKTLDGPERIATAQGIPNRAMIGKFGIGKLASYAVGHRIAHLCKRDERYLFIAVDYRSVPSLDEANTEITPHRVPIIELTETSTRNFVTELFNAGTEPAVFDSLWSEGHWTLAVIDQLRPGITLTPGRLSWVIGNGMPNRPDFGAFVNDIHVEPKIGKGVVPWDLSEPKVQKALASAWSDARSQSSVAGDYAIVEERDETGTQTFADFPNLGRVAVKVLLFDRSLVTSMGSEQRSFGFFLMVRERLVNSDDATLLLAPPSYGTFYRSQFLIYADGLDEDLLADRERFLKQTARGNELQVLQKALYFAARQELESRDRDQDRTERSESLLPVTLDDHFRAPLTSLLLHHQESKNTAINLTSATIERQSEPDREDVSFVDESGKLKVNSGHPFFTKVQLRLGEGRVAKNALQVFDVLAVSERIFEGYLYDLGIEDEQVSRIINWRDGLYRAIALRFDSVSAEDIVREMKESSYEGGDRFEHALIAYFGLLGFEAERDGARGRKDGLVVAPIGEDHFSFTVEAKGSKDPVPNDAADIADAAAPRDAANADWAVIIARGFAGFIRQGEADPEVLQACTSTQRVSIVTLDVLEQLHLAMQTYSYPLDAIMPVLYEIESPSSKMDRVKSLQSPLDRFSYREVLDDIWARQNNQSKGDLVPYRSVWQEREGRWGIERLEDFSNRLVALSRLSGLIRVNTTDQTVVLRQSPDIVAAQIQHGFDLIHA